MGWKQGDIQAKMLEALEDQLKEKPEDSDLGSDIFEDEYSPSGNLQAGKIDQSSSGDPKQNTSAKVGKLPSANYGDLPSAKDGDLPTSGSDAEPEIAADADDEERGLGK